jgi:hypothetical protein
VQSYDNFGGDIGAIAPADGQYRFGMKFTINSI